MDQVRKRIRRKCMEWMIRTLEKTKMNFKTGKKLQRVRSGVFIYVISSLENLFSKVLETFLPITMHDTLVTTIIE